MKEKQSTTDRDDEREMKLTVLAAALFAVRQFREKSSAVIISSDKGFSAEEIANAEVDELRARESRRDFLAQEATNDAVAILAAVEKVGL